MKYCKVCKSVLKEAVYSSEDDKSFNSSGFPFPGKTEVMFCDNCGHLQTLEFGDIEKYYSEKYNFLIEDEDEDQIYSVNKDQIVYRSDHQLKTLLNKIRIPDGANILDYGCAKATLMKKLKDIRPDINPYLYDVSDVYTNVWDKIVDSESNYSTFELKDEWDGLFDLVLSFFSMEHVINPEKTVSDIKRLLKKDGLFYFIVPDPYGVYVGDMLVIDHINHYSSSSLKYLLNSNGFELVEIDSRSHDLALIVIAKKEKEKSIIDNKRKEIDRLNKKAHKIGSFWKDLRSRVQDFEEQNEDKKSVAIYGAALYGSFIASSLKDQSKISCFIDRNPYKQGRKLFDKPIVSPEELPEDVEMVYVGLSPGVGEKAIKGVESWKQTERLYFYL